jgi:hypothetical protein
MENLSYTTIDRKSLNWPPGPWDNEPDKVQWPDPSTGMPCLAVRNPRHGHWCGYTGVEAGHPVYGTDCYDCDLSVHGGVTFTDQCQPDAEETGICHIPGEGESDNIWWVGFDCGHAWDLSPSDVRHYGEDAGGTYRTLGYVREQCQDLAQQLQGMRNES